MPKITIITINYNNLEGLKRTVESVISQTWQEFEYIVIDGGSTDGSAEFIESQNKHFDYWVSEPDKGIYNAMNKGIAKSTGEYLLFLNSGDHFYNDDVMKNNIQYVVDYDIVSFYMQVLGVGVNKIWDVPEKLRFSDLCINTLPHPTTFIKKKTFETIGLYDENLKIVSDWKFFILALFKFKCSFKKVDTVLSTFYLDGISSNSSNQELLKEERQQVLRADFEGHIEDVNQLIALEKTISNLKKSKKIEWMVKLGLLNKI